MRPEQIKRVTKNVGMMSLQQGNFVYELVATKKMKKALELGFAHGVSSCYIAGALEDVGGECELVTIDRESAMTRKPNIEELVKDCRFSNNVKVKYYAEPRSYLWRLMKMIESKEGGFDFVYIDGGHDWYNTGYAFFLVDKLLKPGGYILFDDLDWTIRMSPTVKGTGLPEEEKDTKQVRNVWELLVKEHDKYEDFQEIDMFSWGLTRKV